MRSVSIVESFHLVLYNSLVQKQKANNTMLSGVTTFFFILLRVLLVVAVIANFAHLIVLLQMKSFKSKPIGIIIICITLGDITSDFVVFVRNYTANAILTRTNFADATVYILSILDFGPMVRYYILAVASIEKYLAICHPFKYENHIIIRYIKLWCVMAWLTPLFINIIRDSFFFGCIQYDEILGVHNVGDVKTLPFVAFSLTLPFVTAAFCQVAMIREIRRMRQLPTFRASEDKVVTSASKYLMIIVIFFLLCLFPPVLLFILMVLGVFNYDLVALLIAVGITSSTYGFVNIIAFTALSSSYQQKVKTMFSVLLCRRGRVEGSEKATPTKT